MHWIWAPATLLLLQVAPPRCRPRLLTCCDTKRSAYTRSLSCSHSLPHIAGLQHKARHGCQVNETRLWCPTCSLQVIEDAQFIITHVLTTSGRPISRPWKTFARCRTVNCNRARKVCQSGYKPISILSTQNCPYLVVEVHSRLPECAADPIV